MQQTLKLGILGAARIAPAAVIAPARKIADVDIAAVAARDLKKAEAFAAAHDIPRVHESYDALINDPDVTAIYNPLPNSLHAAWTIKALRAGKHVLCEKPIASNAEEAEAIARAGDETGLCVGEAFHWRYHPLADRIREIIASGEIGALRRIEASFCIPLFSRNDIRWRYDLAGGAMMDVGCYPIAIARHLAGAEPEVISARMKHGPRNVDRFAEVELSFPDGVTGFVRTSMLSLHMKEIWAKAIGDKGVMEIQNPVAPHQANKISISTDKAKRIETIPGETTYFYQLRAFRDWVNGGPPMITDATDGVRNMRVIDAAYLKAGFPLRGDTASANS